MTGLGTKRQLHDAPRQAAIAPIAVVRLLAKPRNDLDKVAIYGLSIATGQPAISLPLHWTENDLPVGLHFTAWQGEEGMLIRLAAQLEQGAPWHTRKPLVLAG